MTGRSQSWNEAVTAAVNVSAVSDSAVMSARATLPYRFAPREAGPAEAEIVSSHGVLVNQA